MSNSNSTMTERERLDYVEAAINNGQMAYAFAYEIAKACDRANAGEVYEPGYKIDGRNTFNAIIRNNADGCGEYGPAFRKLVKYVNDCFGWLHATGHEVEKGLREIVANFETFEDRDDQRGAGYSVESFGRRDRYTFGNPNRKGERLIVDISGCNHDKRRRNDLMNIWKRAGYVSEFMPSHITVDAYVYNRLCDCYARYNPTVKPGGAGYVVNFDWMLEDTEENRARLLDECARRFYACEE